MTLADDTGSNPDTVNVSFDVTNVGTPEVAGDTTVNSQFGVDFNATGDFSEGNDNKPENFQQITVLDSGVGSQSGNPTLESAIHYDDDSSSSTDPEIELAFSEEIDSSTLGNIEIYEDDSQISSSEYSISQPDLGRVVVEFNGNELRTGDVVVHVPDSVTDTSGNAVSNSGNESVTFAPATVKGGNTLSVYRGSNVSVISNSVDAAVTVEGTGEDTDSYFAEGSTGPTSKIYRLSTEDRNLGTFDIDVEGTSGTANVTVRDLGFDLSVDDLNVTDDDTIEADVTANAGNRPIEFELLDNSGDEINTSSTLTTDGQGEFTFEFDTSTADEGDALDPGEYTVRAMDLFSGIDSESSEVTVSQADDEDVNFADNALSTAQGDFFETTVEMTETSEATISFGSEEDGVVANATVEDDDGDDEVTVYVNTYAMQTGSDVFRLDSDSDDNILDQNNPTKTDDLIDAGDYDLEVEAGDAGVGTGVTNADDVATVTLEERSTDAFRMWTGSSEAISSISDLEDVNEALDEGQITESSDTAAGDYAIHQLEASGFEGALDARDNEDVTTAFQNIDEGTGPINLTIEEADPGANQDAKEVVKGYGDNVTVIADGPNDTYFVIVDTGSVNLADDQTGANAEAVPNDDDTELEANFTVLGDEDGATWDFTTNEDDENEETFVSYTVEEPEVNIDAPYNVSNAEGQTISGNTNIAPGTELTLRVRSTDDTSPSFLKTASPVVQSDGTWSTTFDFSEQNVGDTYEIVIDDGSGGADQVTEDGEVVEAVETDTPTPEPETATSESDTDTATAEPDTTTADSTPGTDTSAPDTETPTSTPGFGVVVALTALFAAALLAVRRD
ncbi:BGTF surface domain-containing protein [Halobellus ordinarius]|uniref:DUF7827 domain-containing protein n=1 Tax=Halobellus ordinarius TaxID=3075120 RepID=UPI0028808AC3|nr:BGTF surface domain-containing protein [Halobellus sp. ZY16]